MAWAGERRRPYRKYVQAFRRTHDAKDPGPSGCVAAGPRGVAALDRIADTLFARLLADHLAATQLLQSGLNLLPLPAGMFELLGEFFPSRGQEDQ